ncbi:MAG TPA: sigma-70 family RNA polymerase sigma factor [Solirubrobacteraceae bacterium]|jgi:RNA polymerase sigma factor (sigma-70 family)|nr:sigma-70 family RNA polymerase sigma factor [Solirubrobacteraceae bacterium]
MEARDREDARARLIQTFTPLIGSVARTYAHVPGVDRSELMQEGVVGLLRALERFDPSLRTPFWAYASWWVRQAMQQLVSELSRPVVLSDRALRQLARVRDARRRFVHVHSREPSLPELATDSELTMLQLQRLLVAERQPRGLEEPIDESTRGGATFGDLLCDPAAEEAFDGLATRLGAAEVPRLLARLSGRERRVVESRYGLGGPERTLRELGQVMGVSAERVRQIEQTALEKMRVSPTARPATTRPRPGPAQLRGRRRTRSRQQRAARPSIAAVQVR